MKESRKRRLDTRTVGEHKPIIVRVPLEIHSRLVERAEAQRRSINGQVLFLIEKDLDQTDSEEPVAA